MPAPQPCPGCGCEIDSGLLWFAGPGLARICCNKRCASRAQKRHEALATGKARGRKSMPLLPLADEPVEAELGWSSLNQDVMAQVAARLGLRDCLAAALTCKHWRAHITRGTPHTLLRIDDVRPSTTPDQQPQDLSLQQRVSEPDADSASASPAPSPAPSPVKAAAAADSAAQLLDSARRLMPHVERLSVSVYSRCRQHDYLLKHMRALSRWSGLTSLDISWDTAPDAATSASANDDDDDEEEEGAQSKAQGKAGRHRRSGNGGRSSDGAVRLRRSVFGPLCLGAVGLMRGLQRLSITAAFGRRRTGLFGLAQLEHLTHLELRQAPGNHKPAWSSTDANLGALTALRSLTADAALLSPVAVTAVGPHLTRLELSRFDSTGGYDTVEEDTHNWYGSRPLGGAFKVMMNLRQFRLTLADSHTASYVSSDRTESVIHLLTGLHTLCEAQRAAAPEPSPAPAPGSPTSASLFAHDVGASPSPPHDTTVDIVLDLAEPLAPARPDPGGSSGGDGDGDGGPAAARAVRLELSMELVDALAGLPGLSRLNVCFNCGAAGNLHRLSELSRLTHLALSCDPGGEVAVNLGPWDMQRLCAALGPRLAHLELELPASCLGPEVLSGSLELLAALRVLRLAADTHVRQVALSRWELRGALLAAAARQHVGVCWASAGVGAGAAAAAVVEVAAAAAANAATAAAADAAPSPAVLAEVNAALTPLMFLQELFTAMEDVEGVQQSLQAEAEWRAQHLEDVTRRLAAARVDMAVAEQAVEVVQAAALEALAAANVAEGDAAEWEPAAATAAAAVAMEAVEAAVVVLNQRAEELAEADAVAAAAAGMPCLPHWVLIDELEDGEWDLAAAAALAWLSPAAYGDAAAAPPPPPPERRPLSDLSTEELVRLQRMLVREEVVCGPVFRMGAWLPHRIASLSLRGFAGLEAPPPRRPQRGAALPALAEVNVELPDPAATVAAEQVLRELVEAGGAGPTPSLRSWHAVQV
ncbi:hypothetical protein HYH02_004111 [Chlamydomonas schloesseri]|uniref:F-box domain-containing protein n=1 Tax=Chlamydomonas schloesseri TaxID=2026947 RepID=A0A835WP90_9CHLO|nr:hypothetical protein HYH02_004111 [Chlamydomonas schloesseri]|eukprot:KAG2451513.1 hypothetical protein HYH02_004111 [Chlamydomonas schloesseri]